MAVGVNGDRVQVKHPLTSHPCVTRTGSVWAEMKSRLTIPLTFTLADATSPAPEHSE